jgi:hypothetical protein
MSTFGIYIHLVINGGFNSYKWDNHWATMVKWSVVSNMIWFGQTVWWKSSTYSAPNYFNLGCGCVIIEISCHGFRMSRWWSELFIGHTSLQPRYNFLDGRKKFSTICMLPEFLEFGGFPLNCTEMEKKM